MRLPTRLLLLLPSLVACTSVSTHRLLPATSPGLLRVGRVMAALDTDSIPADRLSAARDYGTSTVLHGAVLERLVEDGLFDANSPATLKLTVTGFRLRSMAVVTWAGSVSGRDHLFVNAALLDGKGQTVWNEAVNASSMRGSVIFGSESGRLENLARTTAGRVARDLRQR
jgi:hypothetical protein